jgi:hypothetical protein
MKHSLDDFLYLSPSLPGVTTITEALNTIVAVLYPQSKPAVNTVADLPAAGNTLLDYRVVLNDGDTKAAGYRWEMREGEAVASWHKVLDMDFGADSILQQWQANTLTQYVLKWGIDDLDGSGVAYASDLAGQRIYGGKSSGTHLTLYANSGDGVGAGTGFVQFGDNVRPISDSMYSLGTTGSRFLKGWFDELQAGTLTLAAGSITDSSGTISFGATNLSTTGYVSIGNFSINATANKITNSSGTIDFDNEHITTTGDGTFNKVTATGAASAFAASTTIADFTFTNGNIASLSATVSFNALDVTTTGVATFGRIDVDSLRFDGSLISATAANTDVDIQANGTGKIELLSNTQVTNANLTVLGGNSYVTNGFQEITGTGAYLLADNLKLDGNTLSSNDSNGNIYLAPNGTGLVGFDKAAYPTTSASFDFGKSSNLWKDIWFSGDLKIGTNSFVGSELFAFRSASFRDAGRTTPAQAGDTIFWDGSQWLASVPDTEIDHGAISGLADDDHTQYALLLGRSGGQTLIGGTAASNNLALESTSHATKGLILAKSDVAPFTNASYSGGWSGTNLGGSSNYFKDLYSKGEHFGLRLENLASNPASSGQNIGRVIYNTTDLAVYVDTGSVFRKVGSNRYEEDTVWTGSQSSKVVTVSGIDARKAIWQLTDNSNDYETMYPSIRATSATSVTITFGSNIPAGSYRLIGLE